MPTFRICINNKDFSAATDTELADLDAARREAVRGALQIGSEEIWKGHPFFGAEVVLEQGDEVLERLVIALGYSTLQ